MAQIEEVPRSDKAPGQNQAPPRYDRDKEAGESSSRDTKIDLSPPKDDAKDHPFSDASGSGSESDPSDAQEFHPWDPHKAAKDIEVGEFYFKRKNYRAALARYQDALLWKDNDAEANFRLGECFEKVNNPAEAAAHYQTYLKILPHGPYAGLAQKALERLKQKLSADASVPAQ
jgi:tetratricopeptide (TPR) repeat protein